DHACGLGALHGGGRGDVIAHREPALGFRARHGAAGPVTAAHEALGVALSAHDERLGAHAAGDDAQVAVSRADGALAGDEHGLTEVGLPGHVVVVAVHRLLR